MPKFGYKCFVGSFLLSLVAVFAATKAYLVLAVEHEQPAVMPVIEAKNIELFSATEESEPIYEKTTPSISEVSASSEVFDVAENSPTPEVFAQSDDILYMPEADDEVSELAFSEIAPQESLDQEISAPQIAPDQEKENELKIADAATAPSFKIPLVHHYNKDKGNVSVSDEADGSKIALASHDVAFKNLGTENQASVTSQTEEAERVLTGASQLELNASAADIAQDSPWEVAETANKHAAKNTIDAYSAERKAEIAALDQQVPEPQPEQQTAYKVQKNILIPIPEDILNNPNLTPQFSSSEENLRLEQELRARHELPALEGDNNVIVNSDGEKDFEQTDEKTSQSLTDSIAEWFSSSKSSAKTDSKTKNPSQPSASDKKSDKKDGAKDQESNNSLFKKLLNIGKQDNEKNILPSELKLAFQPNRAEISGQTLEWLRAFSRNAVENENVIIEIRIAQNAQAALQHKRLKLLHKILANNGVDYNKINIIFTDREPNSFIIRNVRYASEEELAKVMKKADNPWF